MDGTHVQAKNDIYFLADEYLSNFLFNSKLQNKNELGNSYV